MTAAADEEQSLQESCIGRALFFHRLNQLASSSKSPHLNSLARFGRGVFKSLEVTELISVLLIYSCEISLQLTLDRIVALV